MKIDISVVREIQIPLSDSPGLKNRQPLDKGIGLLAESRAKNGRHGQFDCWLVVNEAGQYLAQAQLKSLLKDFFEPAIRPWTSRLPLKGRDSCADTVLAILSCAEGAG